MIWAEYSYIIISKEYEGIIIDFFWILNRISTKACDFLKLNCRINLLKRYMQLYEVTRGKVELEKTKFC